ncbi:MAG: 50S ribosomal protein L30 [Lachnospiraceae bacterium]|nr:50S ribosomal protein L30 [Lachnospiraceae bacterium]
MAENLKITLVKSTIGAIPKHKLTVAALGLKKIGQSVVKKNNDATKGQIQQVRHLVKVEEI